MTIVLTSYSFANAAAAVNITNHASNQMLPSISGDHIAWTDLRNGSGAASDDPTQWSNSEIYEQDRTNGLNLTVNSTGAASGNQFLSRIWGQLTVWQDDRTVGNNSDVYLYDGLAGTRHAVSTGVSLQELPHIGGYNVTWSDNKYKSGAYTPERDVLLYDLSVDTDGDLIPNYLEAVRPSPDPAEYRLTPLLSKQEDADIHGNYIVWWDGRYGARQIVIYDLSTDSDGDTIPNYKEASKPSPDPAEVFLTPNSDTDLKYNPDVSADRVTWVENGLDGKYGVYVYDLTEDTDSNGTPNFKELVKPDPDPAIRLVSSSDTIRKTDPAVYFDRVVWAAYPVYGTAIVQGFPEDLLNGEIFAYDLSLDSNTNGTPNYKEAVRPTPDPANTNLTNGTTQSAGAPAYQDSPDISGNKVVWNDNRSGNMEVYFQDLGDLAPSGYIKINNGVASTSATLVTVSSIVSGSNLEMRFSVDGERTWSTWEQFAASKDLTIPALQITRIIAAEYRDASGRRLVAYDGIAKSASGPPDITPPVTTLVTSPATADGDSGWYKSQATITLSVNEGGSTSYYRWDSATSDSTYTGPVTALQGNHTFYYYSKDFSNNIESTKSKILKVDSGLPSSPSAVSTSHAVGVPTSDVTIDIGLSGASDSASGVDGFSYSFSIGSQDVPDASKDAEETAVAVTSPTLTNGTYYFHLRTKDNAGNWTSAVHTGPYIVTVPDVSPPTTSLAVAPASADGQNGWYKSVPKLTLTVNEPGSTIYYRWDNASPDSVYSSTLDAIQGSHTFNYYSIDTSSNRESTKSKALKVDSLAPVDPVVTGSSHTVGVTSSDDTINISFSGATDDASGVDGFSYSFTTGSQDVPDSTKDVEETAANVTSSALANGTYYFHLRTKDNAGNWTSTVHAGPFVIFKSGPVVTRFENTDPAIVYKSACWSDYFNAAASNGSVKLASKAACTATLNFTGQKVQFLSAKANQLGKAKIYIDGVLKTTIDLYSASLQPQLIVYTFNFAGNGAHSIKVEALHTKNISSKNYYVPVDAFDVTS